MDSDRESEEGFCSDEEIEYETDYSGSDNDEREQEFDEIIYDLENQSIDELKNSILVLIYQGNSANKSLTDLLNSNINLAKLEDIESWIEIADTEEYEDIKYSLKFFYKEKETRNLENVFEEIKCLSRQYFLSENCRGDNNEKIFFLIKRSPKVLLFEDKFGYSILYLLQNWEKNDLINNIIYNTDLNNKIDMANVIRKNLKILYSIPGTEFKINELKNSDKKSFTEAAHTLLHIFPNDIAVSILDYLPSAGLDSRETIDSIRKNHTASGWRARIESENKACMVKE